MNASLSLSDQGPVVVAPVAGPSPDRLVVVGDEPRATVLAERLGVSRLSATPACEAQRGTLWLQFGDEGLMLGGERNEFGAPIRVDFAGGRAVHRQRFGGGRGQLVARACGLGKGVTPQIVDATAGLGRDAFVLAGLGCRVLMLERSAVIAALLWDGLARARQYDELATTIARLSLVNADATRSLAAAVAASGVAPEVVHLDPMYPHRSRSALVKKEMRLFRALVGDDADTPALLEAALDVATHRVVVKRPKGAPPIAGPPPRHVIESKGTRYDLYVHRSLRSG